MSCLPGPGMSRYQNSGSQSAAGTCRPRRGARDGAPAWSAAWTAAATSRSRAVSLLDRQQHALAEAGCIRVFAEKLSGKNADRPELAACLDYLRPCIDVLLSAGGSARPGSSTGPT